MNTLSHPAPSGGQIAVLVIAFAMLAAPIDKYVVAPWLGAHESTLPTARMLTVVFAGLVLLVIPQLRRQSRGLLAAPIHPDRVFEVPMALALQFFAIFAAFGAFALWTWSLGGEPALARRMGEEATQAQQWGEAVSTAGIAHIVFASTAAPLIEELVFRGALFNAWKRQWGWVRSALATSAVFGLLHGAFLPQFIASLIFIALMRRTGSIWSAIVVHAASNALLWYPLLGQFVLPPGRSTGELRAWSVNLAAFVVTWFAVPIYLWLARDSEIERRG